MPLFHRIASCVGASTLPRLAVGTVALMACRCSLIENFNGYASAPSDASPDAGGQPDSGIPDSGTDPDAGPPCDSGFCLVKGSVVPNTVDAGGSFSVLCNYGQQLGCVRVEAGSVYCSWNGWIGTSTTGTFTCPAGADAGTFPVYCITVSGPGTGCPATQTFVDNVTVN